MILGLTPDLLVGTVRSICVAVLIAAGVIPWLYVNRYRVYVIIAPYCPL